MSGHGIQWSPDRFDKHVPVLTGMMYWPLYNSYTVPRSVLGPPYDVAPVMMIPITLVGRSQGNRVDCQ